MPPVPKARESKTTENAMQSLTHLHSSTEDVNMVSFLIFYFINESPYLHNLRAVKH